MINNPIPKVTEVDRLITNRLYLVPCAHTVWVSSEKEEWIPILGDAHTDPELDADFWHFHLDRRFIKPKKSRKIDDLLVFGASAKYDPSTPEKWIAWLGRRCYTTSTRIAPEHELGFIKAKLEPIYQNREMDCLRCPHRGTPLNAIAPDENGVIHCPAHGLKWSAKTGEMVQIVC